MKIILALLTLASTLIAVSASAAPVTPTESACTMVCTTQCTPCLGTGPGCQPTCTTVCNCV